MKMKTMSNFFILVKSNLLLLIGVYSCISSCSAKIVGIQNQGYNGNSVSVNLKHQLHEVDQIFQEWDQSNTPGASIAIVLEGKVIYEKGFGMANLEHDIPNTPRTIFNIASVSKQFTAFSIAYLAQQSILNLDDKLEKFFPDLPGSEHITLRHLIHHTSGLRDFYDLMLISGWHLEDLFSEKQIMTVISDQSSLNFDPGQDYSYSNSGYILLAKILEMVTDQKFSDWTKENLFDPLDMSDSQFNGDYGKIMKTCASSYKKDGRVYKKEIHNSNITGAGGLFTSVSDLTKWMVNLDSIHTDTAVMKLFHQQGTLNDGSTIEYAFGNEITTYKGLPLVVHGGGIAGYRTYLCRFPSERLGIVVLSNLATFNPREKAMKIAEIFLSDTLQLSTKNHGKSDNTPQKDDSINQTLLQQYPGQYLIADNYVLNIWLDSLTLKGRIRGKQQTHTFKPITTDKFQVPTLEAIVEFGRTEGEVNHLNLTYKGQLYHAKQLGSFNSKMVDLANFKGRYENNELKVIYDVSIIDGQLYAHRNRGSSIAFDLAGPNYFTGYIIPQVPVELDFATESSSDVEGFSLSTKRARNIWFTKVQ